MLKQESHRLAGAIGLTVGLGMALAANLTYALPRGPVIVGIGLAAPLVLPLVLWVRSTFTVAGLWRTLLRDLAVLLVAGPAVAISYSHTFHLVLGQGEPLIIALVAPLSSDGVAGISTMALHWAGRLPSKRAQKATPKAAKVTPPKSAPVATAPPTEIGTRHQRRAEMGRWIRSRPTFPSISEVQTKFKVSKSTAVRGRNDARAAS